MDLITITAFLICTALASNGLAYLLTEAIKPPINRKPFNCYLCLAFWFTFFSGVFVAIYSRRYFETVEAKNAVTYLVSWWAFSLAIINVLFVKLKFKVYE